MKKKEITPKHLRSSDGEGSRVYERDDGKLVIVGEQCWHTQCLMNQSVTIIPKEFFAALKTSSKSGKAVMALMQKAARVDELERHVANLNYLLNEKAQTYRDKLAAGVQRSLDTVTEQRSLDTVTEQRSRESAGGTVGQHQTPGLSSLYESKKVNPQC